MSSGPARCRKGQLVEEFGVLKGRRSRRALDRATFRPHDLLLVETEHASLHSATWRELPLGFVRLQHESTSGAIDFIRAQMVDILEREVTKRTIARLARVSPAG